MSLEVIRPDFAPREKPNTTKGQRDNKRLQPQAELSSVSSPHLGNLPSPTQRQNKEFQYFGWAQSVIYANYGCAATTTCMRSSSPRMLLNYESDIVECLNLVYTTNQRPSGENKSSFTQTGRLHQVVNFDCSQ